MHPPWPLPEALDDPAKTCEFQLGVQQAPDCPEFQGLRVLPNFLNEAEERDLLLRIEQHPLVSAQSGKRKLHFGAKVNFKKKKLNPEAFGGFPDFVTALQRRVRSIEDGERLGVKDFLCTDAFVLRYNPEKQSNLDFHTDDGFAYGEPIIDLSLESDSALTFYSEPLDRCVKVPLPRRSLAIVQGPARWTWQHAVLAEDVVSQRTSVTLRTLSETLKGTESGQKLLRSIGA